MAVLFWLCIVLAAVIDRVTKMLAERFVLGKTEVIKIGELDVLFFNITHNTGAAFSSFSGKTAMLSVFTVAALIVMVVYFYRTKSKGRLKTISMGMIVGGGLGNLYDRIAFGRVTDFINLFPFNFVFNFADICVVLGAVLLMIVMLFLEKETGTDGEDGEKEAENG
ncbi:MAG: signal peptidase II [Oscillospiraceae bacterium]|nr:signal peptidase II [Oscillospiraceae bacterium]